mgnify:CR=1 FL=1
MEQSNILLYFLAGVAGLFALLVIVYLVIRKKLQSSEMREIQKLREGTQAKKHTSEILYQKLYVRYIRIPFLKRYLLKIRRRLEIINIDDEYLTRKQTAQILTRTLLLVIPITIAIIWLTHKNYLLLSILLIFEVFMVDTIIDGMVDGIDNKLLKQQINFFSEIRHAYHEFNMVEEAIYQVSQDDEQPEMSRQAEKIYEVLISDDPESELEKYYDVAPNSYLKEFAGVSYLTKEFGDRKVDKASLYLKNLNNITQEMQLEILKRDKLNYVFRSLSFISIAPVLLLEPIKSWAVSNFSFVKNWYYGKSGMIVQILILIITFISYILVRKLKDNGSVNMNTQNTENPWQAKLYKNKFAKKIIDLFLPKDGTKEYKKVKQLLTDAASPLKMEWVYINRIALSIVTFVVSIFVFMYLHQIAIDYEYTQPTTDYNLISMSTKDEKKAMELTKQDNVFLDMFRGKLDTTQQDIERALSKSKYYQDSTDEEIETAAKRILGKLQVVNSESFQWFELLLAFVFAIIGYMSPIWLLMFQAKMRQLEMEDEVMQFQTIILMLMRIERINVEMMLEWLERYSNIFKSQITRCVNDYESGAWEALENLKNDISYLPLIRIVESMQAAVEKIPIKDAFDELDSEREYYRDKRKESNERLIKRQGMIGKVIGFAPMICLFVGYLIIPLVFIGLTSMSSTFSSMSSSSF